MMRTKCFFTSTHNHGIPTHNSFFAPALRCTLFVSYGQLLYPRCSMIGYCVSKLAAFSSLSALRRLSGGEINGNEDGKSASFKVTMRVNP